MSARDPREISLRRAVREARADQPADVDWDAMEERLMRKAQRQAPAAPRRSPYPLAWPGLAVAAAAALWLVSERASDSLPRMPPEVIEATEPLRQSGNALAIGSRVVADEREVSVDHAGRATWTLAAGSSARVTEKGERITLRLERGSVLSEVVASPQPETFVVEAAGARIAVHGTVFRVALEGERVIVQVREGTVAVGPIGAVPGFFLKAPAYGDFAADGRSGSIDGRPLGESEDRRAQPLKLGPPRAPSAAPSSNGQPLPSDADLPLEPSISDIEAGIARIVDATSDCFSRNTKSTEGVQITVRTALSLQIDAEGGISNVDFQPPLSPDVEQCAAGSIAPVVFAASKQGAKVTRMLELKR
ncbi:MAG TPA: FecR family protein [Polyangiaceae bacterium]|nr:FecR family protein [Polyangiaceae bacterium]